MRKILLGTTAVVGLALVSQAANAQQARPAVRPAQAPIVTPVAPPALPATSVAPTGTAAALFQTPVGITGAGPHGADGVPNRPTTPTTSGLVVRLGGYFDFSMGNVSDSADKAFARNSAGTTAAGSATNTNVTFTPTGGTAQNGVLTQPGAAASTLSNAKARQRTDFRNESEINLYVDGIAANGMRYGAMFELQMDAMTSTAGTGTGVDYDELYGFVKGSWGELRFGQEDSAANLLQIRRPGVLWMDDSGAWDEFVANSGYIMAPVNDGNDATKIIYLSPQFMGFDVGISYAPNRFEGEQANIPTYAAGLVLRAYGFQIGGDYTWGNYRGAPATASLGKGLDDSDQWGLGITYTIGAFTLGGMYAEATQDNGTSSTNVKLSDRTQTYFGLGVSYVLAPGMTLFANWNQVEDENAPTAAASSKAAGGGGTTLAKFDSSGSTTRDITVLVAGVRIAF